MFRPSIGAFGRDNYRRLRFSEDNESKWTFLDDFSKIALEDIERISVIEKWLDDEWFLLEWFKLTFEKENEARTKHKMFRQYAEVSLKNHWRQNKGKIVLNYICKN